MAEQSQFSHYSGASEISQFGGSQLSIISTGEDRNSSSWQTGLLACFCVCFLLVCSGIVVAFVMGDATDDESDEFDKTDSGRPTVFISAGPVVIRIGAAVTTTDSTATFAPSVQPVMVICVVGESLVDPMRIPTSLCECAIYSDLVKGGRDFVPLHGQTSWEAFKNATAFASSLRVGLSFSVINLRDTDSTVAYIPNALLQLEGLVRSMGVSAMGVLDFDPDGGIRTTELRPMFRTLDRALRAGSHSGPMVFLGVELLHRQTIPDFVSEVGSLGFITTLIIKTHVHEIRRAGRRRTCESFPVSHQHPAPVPNFAYAMLAEQLLRSQGSQFRIVFSSTMGVLLFVGALGTRNQRLPFYPCERTLMVDYDILCNTTVGGGNPSYYASENVMYKTWNHNNRSYYASFEAEQSLIPKLDQYAVNVSYGWAIFEVQRDVGRGCNVGDNHRVQLIHTRVHQRQP